MSKLLLLLFPVMITSACSSVEPEIKMETAKNVSIVPTPVKMKVGKGIFIFNENTRFVIVNEQQEEFSRSIRNKLSTAAGLVLTTVSEAPVRNYVEFVAKESLGEESYEIAINRDAIKISAASTAGFTYGVASLEQLLPVEIASKETVEGVDWQVPVMTIQDEPRFKWRGLMLDVSRHFFEKDYVLDVIDRMAFLKLNTLHLHLVDDQGWRIEIMKYPHLTEVGGFRVDHEDKPWNVRPTPKPGEEATFGGFYTQEEIREIVSYATSRGITVVPEIEMPAHVMSAIAAYPELSCNENQITVPSGGVWPITEIYCAGKESTFEFLEDVLLEVMDLFPSKYIHVGGDEATKTNWKTCPHCQRRMAEEGLDDVDELQSYFIKRIENFISSHDRVLVGWDEILEGGLAPGATVMSWRGTKGGWEASKQGHDVVMTPASHVYFDQYQGNPDSEPVAFGGYVTLSKVYSFDPVVDSMSVEQKNHVLGGQANMWSEYIPTTEHSEYMMLPRLVALAEVLWSPEEKRNWSHFSRRLKRNILPRYDLQGINYARSSFDVTSETEMDIENNVVKISLKNEFPDAEIRYALNDEELTHYSLLYSEPIEISGTSTVKAAVFEGEERVGETFEKRFQFHKGVGKEVKYDPIYHSSYKGAGEVGMVNVLRGSKDFHDGQWQAWLVEDMEVEMDMDEEVPVNRITVGTLESQGSGIYFPVKVEAFLSRDGENYESVGSVEREFAYNGNVELKNFAIAFPEQKARYIKVIATNLGKNPQGGSSWIFVDEIVVE